MAYKRKKGKSGFKRRGKRGYGGKKTFYKKKAYGRTKTYGGPRQNKIEVSVPAYNEFAALPGSVWGQFDLATQDYGGSPLNQLARKINTLISKSMELAPDQPITNLSPGFAGAIGAFAASARLAEAAVNAEAIRRPHTNAALGITQASPLHMANRLAVHYNNNVTITAENWRNWQDARTNFHARVANLLRVGNLPVTQAAIEHVEAVVRDLRVTGHTLGNPGRNFAGIPVGLVVNGNDEYTRQLMLNFFDTVLYPQGAPRLLSVV